MEGLKAIPFLALILAISGIVIGAGAVVLSKFGDTVDKCSTSGLVVNTTGGVCCLSTVSPAGALNCSGLNTSAYSVEYQATLDAASGQSTIGEQLGTVGIIAIMTIIISIIAGVFVYLRYFQ